MWFVYYTKIGNQIVRLLIILFFINENQKHKLMIFIYIFIWWLQWLTERLAAMVDLTFDRQRNCSLTGYTTISTTTTTERERDKQRDHSLTGFTIAISRSCTAPALILVLHTERLKQNNIILKFIKVKLEILQNWQFVRPMVMTGRKFFHQTGIWIILRNSISVLQNPKFFNISYLTLKLLTFDICQLILIF